MKILGFALVGFLGTYVMFFIFRSWPTLRDNTAETSSWRARRVEFVCALIMAATAALASLAFT
jgi:hypothetical protein